MKLTQVVAMLFIGIVVTSIFLIVNTPNDSNDNINDAPNDYQLPSSLVEVWREDLQYLVQSMKNIHPNLFFHTPETEFDVLVNEIHRNIPTLTEDKIIIELLKLVSRIKDGHTLLFPLQENIGFQIYPLRLYYFDDGLFVVDAQTPFKEFIGLKVVAIGDFSIEKAYLKIAETISHDSNNTIKLIAPIRFLIPEILVALSIIEDRSKPEFILQSKNGNNVSLNLQPISYSTMTARQNLLKSTS